jgi:hypothetical protein
MDDCDGPSANVGTPSPDSHAWRRSWARDYVPIDIHIGRTFCSPWLPLGSEQADDSAEVTLLGSGTQERDDAMEQR